MGALGETLTKNLLLKKGWQFITQNFHTRFGEIDLIFSYQHTLIFIEVKTRLTNRLGYPEEAVSLSKRRHLQKTAEIFLTKFPQYQNYSLRIDVAAIEIHKEEKQIRYYEGIQ